MLLQNITRLAEHPIRQGAFNNVDAVSVWSGRTETAMNRFAGQGAINTKTAIPNGYKPGYSWAPAMKSGGLSLYFGAGGTATAAANLAGGKNGTATIAGLGEITAAEGKLVISVAATIASAGLIAAANFAGKVEAAATLEASGDISTAAGELLVHAALVATLAGQGDLDGAIGALADMVAELSASGSVIGSARADAFMSASIYVNQSEASVSQIATGVWNSLVDEFDGAGTMGEAVAAAGTAGDPWTTILPGSYSGDQAGAIIGAKLLKKGTFIALK